MKKIRLSAREQRSLLTVGGSAAVIVWLYAMVIVKPMMGQAGKLQEQIHRAQEQAKLLEMATVNQGVLRDQHRQLEESVTALQELLPDEEELPRMIERLSDLASQSEVKIQSIFPQRPLEQDDESTGQGGAASTSVVYKDVIIQIDAVSGYHELGTYLSLIEADEKPMQVSSLRISTSPKDRRLRVRLLVQTYFITRLAGSLGVRPVASAPRRL